MVRLRPWLTRLAWLALPLSLAALLVSAWQWQQARTLNARLADGSLIADKNLPERAEAHYAAGWLHERSRQLEAALEHYARAEAAPDPQLAARAKFGMGNLYFTAGLRAADVAAGGSHVQGLAQLELAREAYRSALRVDPELRAARYNLELLERMSPQRRVEGWTRQEDNLHLQQFEEQGWAAMKESHTQRGLP